MQLPLRFGFSWIVLLASLPAQASWTRLWPASHPSARRDMLVACRDATGDVMVLFGSPDGTIVLNECWLFGATNWTQFTGPLPPPRVESDMVYDTARDRIVLFGGLTGSTRLQDTWEWSGATWTNPNPALKPPVRFNHSLAYDRKRGVTVLFAGRGTGSTMLDDLWEWNGGAWVQRTPATMPAGGDGNRMVFDPANESVLLWNGEFWSWDGTVWTLRQPAVPPAGAAFAADLHRRRVIMPFGNHDQFAWEWDGAQWDIRLQASPTYRAFTAVAYDPVRRRTVVYGGYNDPYWYDDTWVFRTPTPAGVVPFGAGCAGTAGVPALGNAPYSLPWLGDTLTMRATNLAPAAAGVVFATGFSSTAPISLAQFGMPGCNQLVIPATTEFVFATGGSAVWSLAVPNTTSLANVHLFQQVFALDAAANALGLTASNAVEITTGIR